MKSKAAAILQELKERYQRNNSIADLAPTVCGLFGLREPDCCGAAPVAAVMDQAEKITNSGKMEKIVLFCTDAMGDHQRELFPEVFRKIEKIAGLRIPSVSVEPSVTPVCYGSIFSGTAPAIHGIMKYEKPVLKVETIFDLLPQYGKKVAIAAVNNCSIDRIFRENPSMNDVYPGESRYILDPFCIADGSIEVFDLGKTPIERESFVIGKGKTPEKGFRITDQCIGCGTCAAGCPQQAIEEGTPYRIRQNNCLHCGLCFENCPVHVIRRLGDDG